MRIIFTFCFVLIFCFKGTFAQWQTDPTINNPVCIQAYEQNDVDLTTDKRNGAIISWSDDRNDSTGLTADIYVQRVDADGFNKWQTNGVAVCTNSSKQSSSKITDDGNGGAIIAWNDYRNGNQDIYAQKVDSSGNVIWQSNGLVIVSKNSSQQGFSIKSDGNNGAVIVWEDSINGNWDIYAQHINENGTPQWNNKGVPVCTNSKDQKNPKMIILPNGETIITWQDKRNGQDYDIYAQKLSKFGVIAWNSNGISIASDVNSQVNPKISLDSSGSAIIAWQDKRNGDYDIYAQRIDSSGNSSWTTNGIVICNATGNQSAVDMTTQDISDGIMISWKDGRNQKTNIYCQKIDFNGNASWSNNGMLISDPGRFQINPNIIGNGSGGGIIVWQDSLTKDWDIYSQQISNTGSLLWTTGGVEIASAKKNQTNPKNIYDGNGGSIYAFKDKRSGDYDVYAYKFAISGGVIGTSQTICSGDSPAAFTEISGSTGSNLTYQWQSSTDGISFANNSLPSTQTLLVTDTLTSTIYYRRLTTGTVNTVACSAFSNVVEVLVKNLPLTASIITGFPRVCQTQANASYKIGSISNATDYIWSYSGTNIIINDTLNSNETTIDFTLLSTSGILTVSGTNACGIGPPSPPYNIDVYPLPGPAGSITGTSVICQNENDLAYSIPAVADADYYTWKYSGTGAIVYGSKDSVTINFSSTATSGILTVEARNICSYSTSEDFPITVNEIPQGSISGNSICSGDVRSGQLIWLDSSGADPYTIIYNDGVADRTQSNVISGEPFDVYINPTTTSNYSLVSVSSNGCTRTNDFILDLATITVSSQTMAITSNPTNSAICSGNETTFSVSATGAYAYQWQVSTDGGANFSNILTQGANPAYSNFNTATLSLSETLMANDGNVYQCLISASCGPDLTSSQAILTINPIPDTAGIIIGKAVNCQKDMGIVYSVPPILNATEYIWEYSGSGATLTVNTNTVTIDLSLFASSGNLTVKGKSPFCYGAKSPNFILTVIESPVSAGLITGPHDICQGQTEVSYQIPILHQHSLFDDPTFTWEYTGTGVTYSGETDPVNINFSETASSGILTVKRKQSCGFGQVSADFDITVHPTPLPPLTIIDSIVECDYFYSIPPIPNATEYIWNYTGTGANLSDSSNSIQVTFSPTATSGYLTVQGSSLFCDGPVSDTKAIGIGQCATEIDELNYSQMVNIFPNPSNGMINIEITNAIFREIELAIFDGMGRKVFSQHDESHSLYYFQSIDLESLSNGIYIIRITTDTGVKSFRISIL